MVRPRDWNALKRIINVERKRVERYETTIKSFDRVTGGLPYGLTIFYGGAGVGKSECARRISAHSDKALYFCSETLEDAPDPDEYPNVYTVDYVSYIPPYKIAIEELKTIVRNMQPDLVVIDSITDFLSVTNKALAESDIRAGMLAIHRQFSGVVPIIAISEVRGTSFYRTTAGGEGVKHNSTLLIEFDHVYADYKNIADAYGIDIGDDIYIMRVVKDKHGISKTKRYQVILTDDYGFKLRPVEPTTE